MHRIRRLLLVAALAMGLFVVTLSVLGAKQKTSVSGTVADAAGLPIADVTIVASRDGAAVGRTTSNGSGSIGFFVLNGLPTPGTYTIAFSKPGYTSETRTIVLGQTGAVNDVNPKLNREASSISGRVTDAAGLPIADVAISASRDGAVVGGTTTNGSGSIGFFVMNGLPTPGTYAIEFSKPGYISETRTVVLGQTGAVTDVNPKLNPSTSAILGLVTEDVRKFPGCGDRGCPLETVQVTLTDSKGSKVRSTNSASSPSDQKGRYSMAGIPSGDYIVTFTRSGYVTQTVRLTLTDNEQRVLDLGLKGVVGSISGNAEGCVQVEIAWRDGTTQVPPVITRVRSSGDYEFVRVQTRGEYLILFEGAGGSVDNTYSINIDGGEKLTGVDGKCNAPVSVLSPPPGR